MYIFSASAVYFPSPYSTSNDETEKDEMPLRVPFIQLIANPAEYHGKKVKVKGVGNLSFEGTELYLCIDNWYYLSGDAIWLNIPWEVVDYELWFYINGVWISEKEAQKYNGKYVLIEGTFNMHETGHRGLFAGGIYDITRFDDFSDVNQGLIDNPKDYYTVHADESDTEVE
jgi:hypothetical protein